VNDVRPDQPASGQPRRFPVLDEEPPARPLWRRLLVPAGVIVLAGAVTAAVIIWPRSAPSSRQAASRQAQLTAAGGHILAVAGLGSLVLSDPAGRNVTKLHGLGEVGPAIFPALDNRYFSLDNGQVLAVSGHRPPAMASTRVQLWPSISEGTSVSPFADHDRQLVQLTLPFTSLATSQAVSLISLATGQSMGFGRGHSVAGDPKAVGVFISVARRGPPAATATATNLSVAPDSKLWLRDAGRPAVLLATAANLDRDLHLSPRLQVEMTPYPSPSGNEVAVTVQPQFGSNTSGIVILNRSGRVLSTVATSAGPTGGDSIAWSPSGTALAFPQSGRVKREAFPSSTAAEYQSCLWSPDGQSIICASGGTGQQWVIATMAAHNMTPIHGPGAPVAWLP
jgi:hypothetical protein